MSTGVTIRAEIRRVEWHDPLAVELRAAMDREIGPRYADRFEGLDAGRTEELQTAFRIDPDDIAATFIVIVDGAAVAHAALRELGDEWELKRLVTLPEHRGRGYSRALIARVEAEVVARGGHRLTLQTGDRQPEAVALYLRLGYLPIPIFEPYRVFAQSQCFARELVGEGE